MGPTVVRSIALATVPLVFGLQAWVHFWVSRSAHHFAVFATAEVLMLAVLGLVYFAVRFVWSRTLGTFWVDEPRGRFVAHALGDQMWLGIFITWIVARQVIPASQDPPFPLPVAMGFAMASLATMAVILLLDRPHIVLTPAGLAVHRLTEHAFHTWDDLDYHEPQAPVKKAALISFRVKPDQFLHVPVRDLDSGTKFLATALRHYVERPEHRHAIGTRDELDRLRALAKAPVAT